MKKTHIALLIIILGFTNGCVEDILEKSPLDALSPDTFYQNENEARMGLTGVYNGLTEEYTPIKWYQFDFMSDDGLCHHSWQGNLEFGAWLHNSSSWAAQDKWIRAYKTIVRANSFIENIKESNISDELKITMTAEAKFIRAFMYSDLIQFYGDVPLVSSVQTLEEAKIPRTPKNEVLEGIIEDFDFSAQNLPLEWSGSSIGRVTRGAALAYKSRILLYNERWEEAASTLKDVMDLGIYELYNDYAGIFKEENENNIEVIFDIQYIKDLHIQPWPSSAMALGSWPTPSVTKSLLDSYYMTNGLPIDHPNSGYIEQDPFINRDPRMHASVVLPGTQKGYSIFIPAYDEVLCGARPRKYADLYTDNIGNCGINTILMRYADILLMRAEALIEAGDLSQEVYDLINMVRVRSNMPKVEDIEGVGLTQQQLRKVVRHERRVEFFMEGLRYVDMLRWKDESLVHDVYGFNKSRLSDPSNPENWYFEVIRVAERSFDPRKGWLWPIPLNEIMSNENLIQNPGF